MGAIALITRLAQALGGFDYVHVLVVMMAMVIFYFGALYAFVRVWLGHAALAVLVVTVALKLQMFHSGISPLIWIFPQDTPLRHWLDIPVLLCLLGHARQGRGRYLAGAACGTGAAIAYVPASGLCLLAAFYGYVVFLLMIKEHRAAMTRSFTELRKIFFYALLPLATAVGFLFVLQGSMVLQPAFWYNLCEPLRLILQGVGALPIYACLRERYFFAFIMGFAVPVIYVWTLLVVGGLCRAHKAARQDVFIIPLCLYGLALYVHYVLHPATSHYYAVGIPLVLVIGFWLGKAIGRCSAVSGLRILLLLVAAGWGALLTNNFFIYYPNIFNIGAIDWEPEKRLYQSQFHFDQDAAMIGRLTQASDPVAMVSSFETKILLEADRKPFFYYAPLAGSVRMDANTFNATSVITQARLENTVRQLQEQAPGYIFVEKKLLGQMPPEFARYFPGMFGLLEYVAQHYEPAEQGMYLTAMRKK